MGVGFGVVLVVVTCVNPCVNPRLRTKPGVCQSKKLAIGSLKLYYTFFFHIRINIFQPSLKLILILSRFQPRNILREGLKKKKKKWNFPLREGFKKKKKKK